MDKEAQEEEEKITRFIYDCFAMYSLKEKKRYESRTIKA